MGAKPSLEERYLEATRRLKARVDHLEQMAAWKEDLEARMWRADATLRASGKALYDIGELELEVELFRAVSDAINNKPLPDKS